MGGTKSHGQWCCIIVGAATKPPDSGEHGCDTPPLAVFNAVQSLMEKEEDNVS